MDLRTVKMGIHRVEQRKLSDVLYGKFCLVTVYDHVNGVEYQILLHKTEEGIEGACMRNGERRLDVDIDFSCKKESYPLRKIINTIEGRKVIQKDGSVSDFEGC